MALPRASTTPSQVSHHHTRATRCTHARFSYARLPRSSPRPQRAALRRQHLYMGPSSRAHPAHSYRAPSLKPSTTPSTAVVPRTTACAYATHAAHCTSLRGTPRRRKAAPSAAGLFPPAPHLSPREQGVADSIPLRAYRLPRRRAHRHVWHFFFFVGVLLHGRHAL